VADATLGELGGGVDGVVSLSKDEESDGYTLFLGPGKVPSEIAAVVRVKGLKNTGYFWDSVVKRLMRTTLPHLYRRLDTDPEHSCFLAYGHDEVALEELKTALTLLATSPNHLSQFISDAEQAGYTFDG